MSTIFLSQCLVCLFNSLYYYNIAIGYWDELYPLLGNLWYSQAYKSSMKVVFFNVILIVTLNIYDFTSMRLRIVIRPNSKKFLPVSDIEAYSLGMVLFVLDDLFLLI